MAPLRERVRGGPIRVLSPSIGWSVGGGLRLVRAACGGLPAVACCAVPVTTFDTCDFCILLCATCRTPHLLRAPSTIAIAAGWPAHAWGEVWHAHGPLFPASRVVWRLVAV
eukprot:scaffold2684_cov124-Isochrysis_galbana.AAC.5